jgi:hypothetical protein
MARVSGGFTPTFLILDDFISILFDGWFEYYSHHFLNASNQFQTLLSIPFRTLDLDRLNWLGWEVIRLNGLPPSVTISQTPRELGAATG